MRRRVVVIGRTGLAVAALDTLATAGDEIAAVIVDHEDDGTDGWQPSLRAAAGRLGLPVLDPPNVNDPGFVERVAGLAADHLLSFQAGPILRAPLIATARIAALNLHYGPLPRYRGVAPIGWAIINGETAHGVTLHHIDPGVDSGPLVRSLAVPIDPTDTGRTLYDRCVAAGVSLFASAWPELRLLEDVPGTPQDAGTALYYNRWAIDFRERRVRWDDDASGSRTGCAPSSSRRSSSPRWQSASGCSRSAPWRGTVSHTGRIPARSSRSTTAIRSSARPAAGSRFARCASTACRSPATRTSSRGRGSAEARAQRMSSSPSGQRKRSATKAARRNGVASRAPWTANTVRRSGR